MARNKTSVIPKEHGAWAMLLVPLVIGWGVAGRIGLEGFLLLATAALFFIGRYPLGQLVKKSRRTGKPGPPDPHLLLWSGAFIGLAGVSGLLLLYPYGRWGLLLVGAIAVAFLSLQLLLQRRRVDRTVWGELLAIAGLSMTGPGAYYALVGALDKTALALWLLPFLYSGSSVFYVKMKVRQRAIKGRTGGWRERWDVGQSAALYLVGLFVVTAGLAWAGAIPLLVAVAFLPLAYKCVDGIIRMRPDLSIRQIGFTELGHSLLFAALLVLIFHFSP